MNRNEHNGWTITYDPTAPVTGRWRAVRFGVGMCANDQAMLKRMIDAKIRQEIEERRERENA